MLEFLFWITDATHLLGTMLIGAGISLILAAVSARIEETRGWR
jgi:hypothetical protein